MSWRTSSSELLEKRKAQLVPNYTSSFSGHRTVGSHDGYDVIRKERKMHVLDEEMMNVGSKTAVVKVLEPVTVTYNNTKGIPFMSKNKESFPSNAYITGDGTYLIL